MIRRLPILPTLIVLIAVGVMIRLGFWQLDRLGQKEAAIAVYSRAQHTDPTGELAAKDLSKGGLGYRRATVRCDRVQSEQLVAGINANGETGWAHAVPCQISNFEGYTQIGVVVGWSKDLGAAQWRGGPVAGTLVPGAKLGIVLPETKGTSFGFVENAPYYLVADPPLAALAANARPDPRDIPNNHFAYAIQWFIFAATALVIYALAVRKRFKP